MSPGKVDCEVWDHPLDSFHEFFVRSGFARGYVVDVVLELFCGLE